MRNFMFNVLLSFLFIVPSVVATAQTSSTPSQYEEMKESLIYRQLTSYINNIQRENMEFYAKNHSVDPEAAVNIQQLKDAMAQIPAEWEILNKDEYLKTKFIPGNQYVVHISTNDPGKRGVVTMEVIGTAESPLVKVREHLRIQ